MMRASGHYFFVATLALASSALSMYSAAKAGNLSTGGVINGTVCAILGLSFIWVGIKRSRAE